MRVGYKKVPTKVGKLKGYKTVLLRDRKRRTARAPACSYPPGPIFFGGGAGGSTLQVQIFGWGGQGGVPSRSKFFGGVGGTLQVQIFGGRGGTLEVKILQGWGGTLQVQIFGGGVPSRSKFSGAGYPPGPNFRGQGGEVPSRSKFSGAGAGDVPSRSKFSGGGGYISRSKFSGAGGYPPGPNFRGGGTLQVQIFGGGTPPPPDRLKTLTSLAQAERAVKMHQLHESVLLRVTYLASINCIMQ